jgi:hypothetical protein
VVVLVALPCSRYTVRPQILAAKVVLGVDRRLEAAGAVDVP